MELHELVSELIIDSKGAEGGFSLGPTSSLRLFLPEVTLCVTILVLLLMRMLRLSKQSFNSLAGIVGAPGARAVSGIWRLVTDSCVIGLVGVGIALFLVQPQMLLQATAIPRQEIFTGMLVFDGFTVFMRTILLGFAFLFLLFTKITGIPDREDDADIYTLVLGSTLGMCLMASANHLLMVFMAIEMASVPSYALAGLLKGRKTGSEAALKYSVYGAGAAGVMLYGISLVAGLVNTVHLPTMGVRLAEILPEMPAQEFMVLALGGLMIMVGLAFKLSAVPFHFWAPDVFEGAPAEVGAFLSVASKAAALALLVRVAIGFGSLVPGFAPEATPAAEVVAAEAKDSAELVASDESSASMTPVDMVAAVAPDETTTQPETDVAAEAKPTQPEDATIAIAATTADGEPASANDNLDPLRSLMGKLIAVIAIITCTFGNLAAYGQSNLKRLLAYSTIAHAGYMMMAVPPMLALSGQHPEAAERAVSALAIYLVLYLFMNLGAFAIVAFLRNKFRSEEIADYAGLLRLCPGMVICFSLILFSLVGLPPLSGFIGKFAIFASLADGYRLTGETYLLIVLVAGGINTAISLFYYLRVVRVMTMEAPPADRVPFTFSAFSWDSIFTVAITLPTALLILWWNWINESALQAAQQLFTT